MESLAVVPQYRLHESHWKKYFDRFGCLVCGRRSSPHDRCGFCQNCRDRVVDNLTLILLETR